MPRQQPDLFHPDETDLPEGEYEPKVYRPDPQQVRTTLLTILAEARAAKTLPWNDNDVRHYRTVFPQMARWLPKEEGEQLCFEFEAEMERLKAA